MADLLVIAAVLILIRGFVRLRGSHSAHRVPLASFLSWAVLLAGGVAIWAMSVHGQ